MRYRLDDLGWFQFEQLCQTLLKHRLGLGVQSWGGSMDLGRDAYFAGELRFPSTQTSRGPFIFQVKFIQRANAAGAKPNQAVLNAVAAECRRIARRTASGQWQAPGHYTFITNAPLSTTLREGICEKLAKVLHNSTAIHSWAGDDLCDLLDDTPRIRTAYPQILGLRDLQELLASTVNRSVVERSSASMAMAADLLPCFVRTESYRRALSALDQHSFVVLTGPPEMGKTAIARTIGMSKLCAGWEVYDCLSPDDFFSTRRDDTPQVYIADDAFGTTEYRPELAHLWGRDLEKLLRTVDKDHWLIWTSRPAPLQMALRNIEPQGPAEAFPRPSEVTVDASALSRIERTLILFRHAQAAGLSEAGRTLVKRQSTMVVGHNSLTPERIKKYVRDLVPRHESSSESIADAAVVEEISEPTIRMRKSFELLDEDYKWMIFAMLDSDGGTVGESALAQSFLSLRGDATAQSAEAVIQTLDGHFVRRVEHTARMQRFSGIQRSVTWTHPSWRDLAIEQLARTTPLRTRFLERCSILGLELALSLGGGVAGERQFPLLSSDDDWTRVESRFESLVNDDDRLTSRIVRFLSSTLERLTDEDSRHAPKVRRALRTVLLAWHTRLQSRLQDVSVFHARQYLMASEMVQPFTPVIDLTPLWNRLWLAAATESVEVSAEEAMSTLDLLLDVRDLAVDYDPRTARTMGLDDHQETLRQVIANLEVVDVYIHEDMPPDEVESEKERVEQLYAIAERIGETWDFADEVSEALETLEYLAGECDSKLGELQEAEAERERAEQYYEDDGYEEYMATNGANGVAATRSATSTPLEVDVHRDPSIGEIMDDL